MSNNLQETLNLPAKIAIRGKQGTFTAVPTTIRSLVNRSTDAKRIARYLKDGWDWNKYTPIIVAQFPDSTLHLLDGDHRHHMHKLVFPGATHIPAYEINVASAQEYHQLFVEINWSNRKNATADEVFVHEVLASLPSALTVAQQLKNCNVSVFGSPDPFGTVGAPNSPFVKVGGFKAAIKTTDETSVAAAVLVMKKGWPNDTKFQAELLHGLAILYHYYPVLSNGSKIQRDFEQWVDQYLGVHTQYTIASDYKSKGGRVHHKHGESVARGILTEYRRSVLRGGCNLKYKQTRLPTKKIDDLFT